MNTIDSLIQSIYFAAEQHGDQKLPGRQGSYIGHLFAVFAEVTSAHQAQPDFDLQKAQIMAVLHDVIEDTSISFAELRTLYGESIAQGVEALSKDPEVEKNAQIKESLERIKQQPREVWIVKMADRISNLREPPGFWSNEKISDYHQKAIEIGQSLQGCHSHLEHRLQEKISSYEQYFDQEK